MATSDLPVMDGTGTRCLLMCQECQLATGKAAAVPHSDSGESLEASSTSEHLASQATGQQY